MKDRLNELDGMRGIAILMVMTFHYLARFPEFYPYDFNMWGIFTYGALGVTLFFIISGFVIALTLARSQSALDFSAKRVGRLLPPMVVCSVITFSILWSFDTPFTEFRRVGLVGFLPSWTFTTPQVWKAIFPNVDYIDGVYWTLFAEVRFYFWAAFLTFVPFFRKFPLTLTAALLLLFANLTRIVFVSLNLNLPSNIISQVFVLEQLHFFVAGIFFYDLISGKKAIWKYIVISICFIIGLLSSHSYTENVLTAAFFLLFFTLLYRRQWLNWLKFRPLRFIGMVSYSAYLLHQNVGVTALAALPHGLPSIFYLMSIAVVIASALAAAWLCYVLVESKSHRYARLISSAFVGGTTPKQAA